jgi:hypothetical protein
MDRSRNTISSPLPPVIDYRAPGAVSGRHIPDLGWPWARIFAVLAFLLVVIVGIVAWRHNENLNREEMRKDLRPELEQWVDGPEARYEIRRVFTGSATKFYRIKVSQAAAAQLIGDLDSGAPDIVRGDVNGGKTLPEPDWWKPTECVDVIEFDCVMGETRWAFRKYWVSPSTGWVYMNIPGH